MTYEDVTKPEVIDDASQLYDMLVKVTNALNELINHVEDNNGLPQVSMTIKTWERITDVQNEAITLLERM